MMKKLLIIILSAILTAGCGKEGKPRHEINLNGTWEIAVTDKLSAIPLSFTAEVPVPGLIDMARPAPEARDTVYENKVYWYRRILPASDMNREIVRLKINKARYHTRVWVNGQLAGENPYNFTPSLFDIKRFLKTDGTADELVIAVGCWNNLPDTVTNGWDFEKIKYIPGIYDNVKLILSDLPLIQNVQTMPDIPGEKLRVVAELLAGKAGKGNIKYTVREAVSKLVIASGSAVYKSKGKQLISKADFFIPMPGCRLWSPDNPFLYELEIRTSGDNLLTKFGMRSFAASPDSGFFLLNGKPYYMRGTNVCIYRFFEDPARNGLPWNSDWVVKLHSRFREMHWDGIRYCIGFPPERWYEIADSLGFLIQDEFPLWTGGRGGFQKHLGGINSKQLAAEYLEWMRERWNHPCVVVWDAQNESVNDTTGKAIRMVRQFDLSGRPWDNGWAAPDSPLDAIESHPYLFSRYQRQKPSGEGYLKELFSEVRIPGNDPNSHSPLPDGKRYNNPVILNEYGWIWLNRDGSTTTLTDKVYENVFPEANTPEKRLEIYAKTLGILTEYWRTHRKAAAVFHFCGLGYSRPEKPRGQTSDHFTNLENLVFEPHFYKYVRPAFSPVGIMAEFWENKMKPGQQFTLPVHIISDVTNTFNDSIKLAIYKSDKNIYAQTMPVSLDGPGKRIIEIPVKLPYDHGSFRLEAGIIYNGEQIKSIREFVIK